MKNMSKVIKKGFVLLACAFMLLCGSLIPALTVSASAEETSSKRYYDDYSISTYAVDTETINYSKRTYEPVTTTNNAPDYYANTDLSNSCGPTAGGIVVGFYDKYYENLIPNYTAYYTANGRYKVKDKVYVPAVMQELYTLMRTNVDDVGVSETDCKNGLKTYVEQKGYNLSYTSVKNTWGSFQLNTVKNAIDNNKPVLLFCDQAGLIVVSIGDHYDKIVTTVVQNRHVMVAYGYCTLKYYNGLNENFRTDTYLMVSTGLLTQSTAFVQVNTTAWLDNGYAVTITA